MGGEGAVPDGREPVSLWTTHLAHTSPRDGQPSWALPASSWAILLGSREMVGPPGSRYAAIGNALMEAACVQAVLGPGD